MGYTVGKSDLSRFENGLCRRENDKKVRKNGRFLRLFLHFFDHTSVKNRARTFGTPLSVVPLTFIGGEISCTVLWCTLNPYRGVRFPLL